MTIIRAEEFKTLLEKALNEKTKNPYYTSTPKEFTRESPKFTILHESDTGSSNWNGYNGTPNQDVEMETITFTRDIDELKVADMLSSKGFATEFYPLKILKNKAVEIDLTQCRNRFNQSEFDDELFNELCWCLEHAQIEFSEFTDQLKKMNQEQKKSLYQKPWLDNGHKKHIYYNEPAVDPELKRKEVIQEQIKIAEKSESYNECKEILMRLYALKKKGSIPSDIHYNKNELLENAYKREIENLISSASNEMAFLWISSENFDIIEDKLENSPIRNLETFIEEKRALLTNLRIKFANHCITKKKYTIAEKIFLRLVEIDTSLYIKLVEIYYHENKIDLAQKYLELYREKNTNDINYCFWRAVNAIFLNKYSTAIECLPKLTEGNDPKKLFKNHFLKMFSPEQINKLCNKLYIKVKKKKGEDKETYKRAYFSIIELAADAGYAKQQYRLYSLHKKNNPDIAQEWLSKAKDQNYPEAILQWARFTRNNSNIDNFENTFGIIKPLVKSCVDLKNKISKEIMKDYYHEKSNYYKEKANSFETDNSSIIKKRKSDLFIECFDKNINKKRKIAPSSHASIPNKNRLQLSIPKIERSVLDIRFFSKTQSKEIWIKDTTTQIMPLVVQAFEKDLDKKKRNYVTANLTIIFSDKVDKNNRVRRLARTIPVYLETNNIRNNQINIQDILKSNTNINVDLKKELQSSRSNAERVYHKMKDNDNFNGNHFSFIENSKRIQSPEKHSEFALYQFLSQKENIEKLISNFAHVHKNEFVRGCKVYGIILDIASYLEFCDSCKTITLDFQNSKAIKNYFPDVLQTLGYLCQAKNRKGIDKESTLYCMVRARAASKLKKDTQAFSLTLEQDLKEINNRYFFHIVDNNKEDNTEPSNGPYLVFTSGTNAPRQKA